jgi:hypothetical protein
VGAYRTQRLESIKGHKERLVAEQPSADRLGAWLEELSGSGGGGSQTAEESAS